MICNIAGYFQSNLPFEVLKSFDIVFPFVFYILLLIAFYAWHHMRIEKHRDQKKYRSYKNSMYAAILFSLFTLELWILGNIFLKASALC
ncbi:MAG: hypothetical protein FGM57_01330 [Candidatus Taylorbacteria bacterium]|nr:hypothetical protein [Candidatus Taylorbacteria bacterium]